jgi:hypothetical protein
VNTYRKNAIWVGILFILCSATCIIGMSLTHSILDKPDYLSGLAANQNRVITGALLEFIWAATGAGIAIGLYPLLKKQNGALALGSVGFRVVEGVFVLLGTASLLALLTLGKESVSGGAGGTALLGLRDWSNNVIGILAFGLGALTYYSILYKSRLIPRWLSGWGIIGAVLCLAATTVGAFNHDFLVGTGNTILNAPIGVQEMVLAVWLIVKGFNQKAIAALPAKQM